MTFALFLCLLTQGDQWIVTTDINEEQGINRAWTLEEATLCYETWGPCRVGAYREHGSAV